MKPWRRQSNLYYLKLFDGAQTRCRTSRFTLSVCRRPADRRRSIAVTVAASVALKPHLSTSKCCEVRPLKNICVEMCILLEMRIMPTGNQLRATLEWQQAKWHFPKDRSFQTTLHCKRPFTVIGSCVESVTAVCSCRNLRRRPQRRVSDRESTSRSPLVTVTGGE